MTRRSTISPAEIETLFLDAGNTLISMDFAWVARELGACGVHCDIDSVRRAEAAARPATSKYTFERAGKSGREHFEYYLERIIAGLPGAWEIEPGRLREIRFAVAARLKQPGEDFRLWSEVLPGVVDALIAFNDMRLKLVVVSNSDGSVERALTELGLASHVDAILDSAVVGHEKPDPRFFEHAIEISGAARAGIIHVGDMYYQDVCGARSAGLDAVLLDPHDDWEIDDCMRFRDLADVARWIRLSKSNHP